MCHSALQFQLLILIFLMVMQLLRCDVQQDFNRHCCPYINSTDDSLLMSCSLRNHINLTTHSCSAMSGPHFHIITSFTRNIRIYAKYSIAINTQYANYHGHSMHIIDEDAYHDKDSLDSDARWNKILFLINELKSIAIRKEYESALTYLVWLDADLVFVDFDLNLASITQQYSQAHIIMSKDKKSAPFVGNTGSIIVRVSDWSLQYLQLWWSSYDRSRCCDQNALTWLYDRNIPFDVKDKLAFLPAAAINTDFPCWKNHNEQSGVLHLAGLTNLFRVKVFHTGLLNICKFSDPSLRSKQLGLTIEYLRAVASNLYVDRYMALTAIKTQLMTDWKEFSLSSLRNARLEVFDIIKQDDTEPELNLFNTHDDAGESPSNQRELAVILYDTRKLIYDKFHSFVVLEDLSSTCSTSQTNVDKCGLEIEILKDMIGSGFELVLAMNLKDYPQRGTLCKEITSFLGTAIGTVLRITTHLPSVQSAFLYFNFKCLQLSSCGDETLRIDHLKEAVTVWDTMVTRYQYYGTNYVIADPQKEYIETLLELGARQCGKANFNEGLPSLLTAIHAQEELIRGYEVIKIATDDIIKQAHYDLAELTFNYGLCVFDSGKEMDGTNYILQAKSILEEFSLSPLESLKLYQNVVGALKQVMKTPTIKTKRMKRTKKI